MKKYLLLIVIAFAACDSFVEVETPDSQLTGTIVFENRNTANAALADLFSKLRDTGLSSGNTLGAGTALALYADELDYYGFGSESAELFGNALIPTSAAVSDAWNHGYHQIYCANAIIEGVAASAALSQQDKDYFTGEALFVRAWVHFQLVNVFGGVPYVTGTNYGINRLLPRMQVAEVYTKSIADLENAVALLPEEYPALERVVPNRTAAQALLARVYLYNGQWAEAADMASAVLNNPLYALEQDLDKVFLKESPETIWQYKPQLDGANTDEASTYIFLSGPPPAVALTVGLVDAFEPGDQRRVHWITEVTDGISTWHHAAKYKDNGFGVSTEYSIALRLSELYLIRAEARAQQGELTTAKEDLNAIRHRAGLGDTPAMSQDEILQAIQNERRVELFTESGHRFFDLKRNGTVNAILSAKPGWNVTDALWPIPETDLLANPVLTQNPGY